MGLKTLLAILIGEVFVLGCFVIGIKTLFEKMTAAQERTGEQLKALIDSVGTIEGYLEDHYAEEREEQAKARSAQLKKLIDAMPESEPKDALSQLSHPSHRRTGSS
jgi:hypothetical protein